MESYMIHVYNRYLAPFLALFLIGFQGVSAEVRLGATIPLTGDFATYGQQIKDGIELAKRDLQASGYTVETFYEDVPMPGRVAATALNKLVSQDKIHALAGNFLNPAFLAMKPIIERNELISFHTATADDFILAAGETVFSTNAKIKDEAKQLAEYAYNSLGARTAVALNISTIWGDTYAKHFIKHFLRLGGEILFSDVTMIGEKDLRPVLTKVRAKNPDVLLAAHMGTNLGAILKQARKIGITAPILAPYETEDPSVLETAGIHAEGVRYFLAKSNQPSAEELTFAKRFVREYGHEPLVLSTNAYDATMIIVKALEQCKLQIACAKNEIYAVNNYNGASGRFSIDADGAASREFILKTVKNGQFVRVPH